VNEKGIEQLKEHEGFRAKPYRCTAGKLTIGYGTNLDAGVTEEEADKLLEMDIDEIEDVFKAKMPDWYFRLLPCRQSVLINMAYNLGINGLMKFKRMFDALGKDDFETASEEMLNSRWAAQVGNRAKELSKQMRTGKWSF